jgi:phosphate/sulfate permease
VVIVVALRFDYTNGFHDAANAIVTSVSTRTLAPRTALVMAAVMNLVGAFRPRQVARQPARSAPTPHAAAADHLDRSRPDRRPHPLVFRSFC